MHLFSFFLTPIFPIPPPPRMLVYKDINGIRVRRVDERLLGFSSIASIVETCRCLRRAEPRVPHADISCVRGLRARDIKQHPLCKKSAMCSSFQPAAPCGRNARPEVAAEYYESPRMPLRVCGGSRDSGGDGDGNVVAAQRVRDERG